MRTYLNYLVLLIFLGFLSFGYYYYYTNQKKAHNSIDAKGFIDSTGGKISHDIVETDHSNFITKDEISGTIKDYIEKNPDVIIKSVDNYMKTLASKEKSKISQKIESNKNLLENQDQDPRYGSANSKYKIIEFFDYSCSFCKMMAVEKSKLFANNNDVYFIFKETPILGPFSLIEAKVSMSVYNLDKQKYLPFHLALLKSRGLKTEEELMNLAVAQGIDRKNLERLMDSSELNKVIENNILLARKIGITGTPAYIINGKLYEGALSYQDMMKILGKNSNSTPSVDNDSNNVSNEPNNNSNNVSNESNNNSTHEADNVKESLEGQKPSDIQVVPAPPPSPPKL